MSTPTTTEQPSQSKTLVIFVLTIVGGFFLFALPHLFFGITGVNGGIAGINLALIALFQFVSVTALVYFSLRSLGKDFRFIGLSTKRWKMDALIGLVTGIAWALFNFGFLLPNTGGAERRDVVEVLESLDGTTAGLISYIVLGVLGGGITEEIYNRGFFINVLTSVFRNTRVGLWVSALLSILFFAAGHLPASSIEWVDILATTTAFTVLFLLTRRLTAPMVAHGTWNMLGILGVNYLY